MNWIMIDYNELHFIIMNYLFTIVKHRRDNSQKLQVEDFPKKEFLSKNWKSSIFFRDARVGFSESNIVPNRKKVAKKMDFQTG